MTRSTDGSLRQKFGLSDQHGLEKTKVGVKEVLKRICLGLAEEGSLGQARNSEVADMGAGTAIFGSKEMLLFQTRNLIFWGSTLPWI